MKFRCMAFTKIYESQLTGCSNHSLAASLVGPSGLVSEGDGEVRVCVTVINSNNIPIGGANIEVFVSENAGVNPATRKQQ